MHLSHMSHMSCESCACCVVVFLCGVCGACGACLICVCGVGLCVLLQGEEGGGKGRRGWGWRRRDGSPLFPSALMLPTWPMHACDGHFALTKSNSYMPHAINLSGNVLKKASQQLQNTGHCARVMFHSSPLGPSSLASDPIVSSPCDASTCDAPTLSFSAGSSALYHRYLPEVAMRAIERVQ